MATIEPYETGNGKTLFLVRYRDPFHKQRKKSGFTGKREAQAFLNKIETAKHERSYLNPNDGKATIEKLGAEWIANDKHLKPSSVNARVSSWKTHVMPYWGARRVGDIRYSEVQAWVTELASRKSATIVHRACGVLQGILETAVRDKRIASNPARGVKLPRKLKRPHRYLTLEELGALAGASGANRTLVLLLGLCGLRWGEAIGLRVQDVDLMRGRVNVNQNAVETGSVIVVGTPKMHEIRSVPIPPPLRDALTLACDGKSRGDLVFPGRDGSHMKRVSATKRSWLMTAKKQAGIEPVFWKGKSYPMTPHDLRHTAASLLVSQGASPVVLAKMLGHASTKETLDTYADLYDTDLDTLFDGLDEAKLEANVPFSVPLAHIGKTASA
jgi:integrase